MNYTSFTALIITFHHMSAMVALILALLVSGILYGVLIRKRKNRFLWLTITFLVASVICAALAEEMFLKAPVSIEIVQAG